MPYLLVGQSRTVVQPCLQGDGRFVAEGVAEGDTYVAYVSHLFGYERAVGEVLLVGRAVCVDAEGHAHLSGGHRHAFRGEEAGVGVQHPDLPFVREVDFGFVCHDGQDVAREADACVPHFKAACLHFRLVLELAAYGAVYLRQVIFRLQLFLVDPFSVFVAIRGLGAGGQRQQENEQEE